MKRIIRRLAVPALLLALVAAFLLYTGSYYRAADSALPFLESDPEVTVRTTDYGWHFDGPGEEQALIFYPGAKVEETAYAPLLHRLAAGGMDACLVKMPFRLAVFGADRAEDVLDAYEYAHWWMGGHSLGGVMAARFAASHADRVEGVVLLASYADQPLPESLTEIRICGSEDGVLDRERWEAARANSPAHTFETVIPGGNHAGFGDYGPQAGDGIAGISPEAQQAETVAFLLDAVGIGDR